MASTKLVLAVVDSMTSYGRTYTVDATEDGEVRCSCPAWQYRDKPCKHLVALASRLGASWPLARPPVAADLWPRVPRTTAIVDPNGMPSDPFALRVNLIEVD